MNNIKQNKFFYNKSKKAFTLVELIIVIVILAILATIAFMSFESYGAQSRDSTRVTNLASITKGLGVYQTTAGKFPSADSGFDLLGIVGGVPDASVKIGSQGYIGDRIAGSLNVGGSTKDPVDSSSISYASNSKGCKFELVSFLENNDSNPQIQNGVDQGIFMNGNSRRYPFIQGITETYSPGDSNLGIIVEKDTTTNSYKTDNLDLEDGPEDGKEWKGLLANNTSPQDIIESNDYQKIVDNYNKCPTKAKSCEWTEKDYGEYNGYTIDKNACYSWIENDWILSNGGKEVKDTEFNNWINIVIPEEVGYKSFVIRNGGNTNSFELDPSRGEIMDDTNNDRFDGFYPNSELIYKSGVSHIYYTVTKDLLVVSWNHVGLEGSSNSDISFQLIYYNDGMFKVQFGDMNYDGYTDWRGVGLEYDYYIGKDEGDSLPTAETAILFTPANLSPIPPIPPVLNWNSGIFPCYDISSRMAVSSCNETGFMPAESSQLRFTSNPLIFRPQSIRLTFEDTGGIPVEVEITYKGTGDNMNSLTVENYNSGDQINIDYNGESGLSIYRVFLRTMTGDYINFKTNNLEYVWND